MESKVRHLTRRGAGFDYGGLPRDAADKARASAERIRERLRHSLHDLIEIGRDLAKVKAVLGHGHFGRWLRDEFAWSGRSAERLLAVAERFGHEFDTVSNLNLQASAAYLLAAPSAPEEARRVALRRARAGETITAAVARKLVARAKQGRGAAAALGPGRELRDRLTRVLDLFRRRCDAAELAALAELLRGYADGLHGTPGPSDMPPADADAGPKGRGKNGSDGDSRGSDGEVRP